jgi:mono/diheme cytochrome c family protein
MRITIRSGLFAASFLFFSALVYPQIEVVPGSAQRGEAIFTSKGCVNCHAIAGEGGTEAPDLAERSARLSSPDLLASVMWNHAPSMWARMEASTDGIPTLNSREAADLFSYFYSRLFFSVPGDAGRGQGVFVEKKCAQCHALDASIDAAMIGPAVPNWARVRDPILWAERMWNHSEEMYVQMEQAGIDWPRLTTQEMVDLLTFLRNLPATESERAAFEPGEPELGRAVFTSNCEGCHSFGESLPNRIDLLERPQPKTLTDYAAEMWNHAPRMQERAGQEGLPKLEDGAMTHLVGYLFSQRYFSEPGDPRTGALVYEAKRCIVCHELERGVTGAPDLTGSTERFSPITMTASLWNHGPQMLRSLEERGFSWPVFEDAEMRDLIAYLNSRLVPRVAD